MRDAVGFALAEELKSEGRAHRLVRALNPEFVELVGDAVT